jgi:hypothetical protein
MEPPTEQPQRSMKSGSAANTRVIHSHKTKTTAKTPASCSNKETNHLDKSGSKALPLEVAKRLNKKLLDRMGWVVGGARHLDAFHNRRIKPPKASAGVVLLFVQRFQSSPILH